MSVGFKRRVSGEYGTIVRVSTSMYCIGRYVHAVQ